MWDAINDNIEQLYATNLPLTDIAVNSNGIIFVSTEDSIFRLSTSNGSPTLLYKFDRTIVPDFLRSGANISGLDIRPDGQAAIVFDGLLWGYSVNLSTGETTQIIAGNSGTDESPGDILSYRGTSGNDVFIKSSPDTVDILTKIIDSSYYKVYDDVFVLPNILGLAFSPEQYYSANEFQNLGFGLLGFDEDSVYDLSGSTVVPIQQFSLSGQITGAANYIGPLASPRDDHPNSAATTGVVSVNGQATIGSIETAGDLDVFKVNLVAGGTYQFTLTRTSGSLDPFLRLYDTNLNLITSNDDDANSLNSLIDYTANAGGVFYLQTSDYDESGTGTYGIAASGGVSAVITGTNGDNMLTGSSAGEAINALAGNDVIRGNAGNDVIDGGSGVDIAELSGFGRSYSYTQGELGVFTVTGPDGVDTLRNVEYYRTLDRLVRLYPGSGTSVNFGAAPSTYMAAIRDFDGNDLGGTSGWKLIGSADVNGDGDTDRVFVNQANGRFAEVATAPDGLVYFADHGWAGETRVVGIYVDPLVQSGQVQAGGPNDSQRRFQNDLAIGNIKSVLGAGDYDKDGLQEVYFSITDGTAYLHAYMHADGNIRYANYQSQQQVIDFLTQNGWAASTYAGWFG